MYPELFKLPLINTTVKSYGLMMVIGFICALWLMRRLSRSFLQNPQLITNIALYTLIAGVVGARLFHVIHYHEQFQANPIEIFYIWQGGLEFYGGVILAIAVIVIYLLHYKLPVRLSLDVVAVGLMLALSFGRIGCFLNGCCYGKPTNIAWGVRFPPSKLVHRYSFAFESQVYPNPERNRTEPQLQLPPDYFENIINTDAAYLKPYDDLSLRQQDEVTQGKYRCLPVHPTQLYESAGAVIICLILYLYWNRNQKAVNSHNNRKLFTQPGFVFSLALILYGFLRFFMEFLRDDNPFEFDGLTVSQNISIAMIVLGIVLVVIFERGKIKSTKS
jgi:phosphatidylglycerol---prolipoprotein diacylglyceryl transferase